MRNKQENLFLFLTGMLSVLQGVFYIFYGFKEGFSIYVLLMIGCDFLFIPSVLIFRKKGFFFYLIFYSVIILICTAFNQTYLFNNFSALLCIFIAIVVNPKYKKSLMVFYIVASSVFFVLNDEPAYYLLIHIARSLWIFIIYDFVIYKIYNRKPVVLFDDEIKILEQLCEGKLIKEIELNGMSERTIRRRLDSARERNGIKTNDELKELFKKTYKKN